jgi:hypothetical protein
MVVIILRFFACLRRRLPPTEKEILALPFAGTAHENPRDAKCPSGWLRHRLQSRFKRVSVAISRELILDLPLALSLTGCESRLSNGERTRKREK